MMVFLSSAIFIIYTSKNTISPVYHKVFVFFYSLSIAQLRSIMAEPSALRYFENRLHPRDRDHAMQTRRASSRELRAESSTN